MSKPSANKQSECSYIPDIIEAANKVSEAEMLWSTVAKYSPIAMCIVDSKGYFLEVNPAACKLFEKCHEELIGTRWQDYTHKNDLKEDEEKVFEVLSEIDKTNYQFLKRYVMSDGRVKKCLLKVASVSDNNDVFCYFISLIVDLDVMSKFLSMANTVFEVRDKSAS